MSVVVITAPDPIVTLEEARKHLLVDSDDDDTMIETFVQAATAWLDGPAGWLGRSLGIQVLEWSLHEWPAGRYTLPYPPSVEIVSISYVDPTGLSQSWDFPTPLVFDDAPAVRGQPGDVKIRYRSGYGAPSEDDPTKWTNAAPAPIKVAILMLVAQWYRSRETVSIGAEVYDLPFSVEALLSPYRVLNQVIHGPRQIYR